MSKVLPAARIDLMATRAAASRAGQWMRDTLVDELDVREQSTVGDIVAAVHGTFASIVAYAYSGSADGVITITADRIDDEVLVQLLDDGREFDPRNLAASDDPRQPGPDRLQMVGSLMTEVVYEHTPDGNRWRLTKSLAA